MKQFLTGANRTVGPTGLDSIWNPRFNHSFFFEPRFDPRYNRGFFEPRFSPGFFLGPF
jgi:hypothetical protein